MRKLHISSILILVLFLVNQNQAFSASISKPKISESASTKLPNYQDLIDSTKKVKTASHNLLMNLPKSRKDISGDNLGICYGKNGDSFSPAKDCYFGDKASRVTIALIGDSHAAQWFTALNTISINRGLKLLSLTRSNCPIMLNVPDASVEGVDQECFKWNRSVIDRLKIERPVLTIVASCAGCGIKTQGDNKTWRIENWKRLFSELKQFTLPIQITDTPLSEFNISKCIEDNPKKLENCVQSKTAMGLFQDGRLAEVEAAADSGINSVDGFDLVCPTAICPIIVNDISIYSDGSHLTNQFVQWISVKLGYLLNPYLPITKITNAKLGGNCQLLESSVIVNGTHLTCRNSGEHKVWTLTLPKQFGVKNGGTPGKPCQREGDLYWEGMARVECVSENGVLTYQIKKFPKISKEVVLIDELFTQLPRFKSTDTNIYRQQVTIEPGYENTLWAKDSVGGIESAINLLNALKTPPAKPLPYLIFWNFDYAKPKLPSYCAKWASTGGGGLCSSELIFVNLGWFASSRNFFLNDPMRYQDESQRYLIIGNIQHELGHWGQNSNFLRLHNLTNGGINFDKRPAWLREGAVEFFKALAYSQQFNLKYSEARNITVHTFGNRCTPTSLKSLTDSRSYESLCEYNNGVLAVEYLVSKTKDLASIFSWESKIRDDSTLTQAEAFRQVFGLDLQSFMTEADLYIKQETK